MQTIAVPGQALRSFDIGYADAGLYAWADRSNRSVDLIDARSLRFLGRIDGFAGARSGGQGGPNGVLLIDGKQVWAGDGGSLLRVADLASRRIVATIATGGRKRVDELAYDARDHLVIAANNADRPPFVSFISTQPPYRVVARLELPRATQGLEQPLWDARTGLVYLAIPELDGVAARGGIAVIDPRTARQTALHEVARCMPAGLALGPDGKLLVGCSDDAVAAGFAAISLLLDPGTGRTLQTYRQVGGSDEVWYDAAGGRFLLGAAANPGGPVLGVIDARSGRWLRNLPSGRSAHSVAADPVRGRVFMPLAAGDAACPHGCVAAFGD
ncbi:MAG: cytochrome C nitrite reductase [Burkholderiales bacterium]|nr:cytochrome C nitrite reductase [Burkholderiales bacterium]MBU6501865.1 cytochrome C nitrite reductase [Burkholderiales bacterium]MDE2159329.1 cytochrome C nitrite reductase [Burkholderiales bacterium]MDE2502725.1 cytochrome C nitrite reductase [Burkholderiales bacterium]